MLKQKRVAILGGGIGGLSTALELTDPENPRKDEYQVTVYQQGWRLGGKGASGRNRHESQRIEEHGLHVWLGFYENSFRSMRAVFEEWEIPEGHPWGTGPKNQRWKSAFKGGDFTPLAEETAPGKWRIWPILFPPRPGEPGDGGGQFSVWSGLEAIQRWLRDLLGIASAAQANKTVSSDKLLSNFLSGDYSVQPEAAVTGETGKPIRNAFAQIRRAEKLEKSVGRDPSFFGMVIHHFKGLVFVVRTYFVKNRALNMPEISSSQLFAVLVDLSFALLIGLIFNLPRILRHGFDVLDGVEFRRWLRRYGARKSSVDGPFISALYDGAFGSVGGSGTLASEDIGAGTAIRALLRTATDYKGHNYWRMQAGMGDTVFTPIYEVLKQRGVKFEFFHRIETITVSANKMRVEKVKMRRQATLKDSSMPYQPLVGVPFKNRATNQDYPVDLQCWPSEAHYDQLVEGENLRDLCENHKVNLENPAYIQFYTDPGEFTLIDSEQYSESTVENQAPVDMVVLAIPVAAIEVIGAELMAAHKPFGNMVKRATTVRTVAFQAWLRDKDRQGLGFDVRPDDSPILTNFRNPLNTWADMTHLTSAEPFPEESSHIAYFCGPMPEEIEESDCESWVREQSEATLDELAGSLWPGTVADDGAFDDALIQASYYRTNTFPSERYTLSPANSLKHRLRPDESGFANLVLAGDWTRNNLNIGSIEATVMSGKLAAHAISGYPEPSSVAGYNGP